MENSAVVKPAITICDIITEDIKDKSVDPEDTIQDQALAAEMPHIEESAQDPAPMAKMVASVHYNMPSSVYPANNSSAHMRVKFTLNEGSKCKQPIHKCWMFLYLDSFEKTGNFHLFKLVYKTKKNDEPKWSASSDFGVIIISADDIGVLEGSFELEIKMQNLGSAKKQYGRFKADLESRGFWGDGARLLQLGEPTLDISYYMCLRGICFYTTDKNGPWEMCNFSSEAFGYQAAPPRELRNSKPMAELCQENPAEYGWQTLAVRKFNRPLIKGYDELGTPSLDTAGPGDILRCTQPESKRDVSGELFLPALLDTVRIERCVGFCGGGGGGVTLPAGRLRLDGRSGDIPWIPWSWPPETPPAKSERRKRQFCEADF